MGRSFVKKSQLLSVEGAAEHYEQLLRANPDDVWAITMRAVLLFKFYGQNELAIEELDGAIRRNLSYAPAYALRGSIFAEGACFERAVQDFDEALRLDSKSPYTYLARGMIFEQSRGLLRFAIDDFRSALQLYPTMALPLQKRAELRAAVGDHKNALADYTTLIMLHPLNAAALYKRSRLLSEMGEHTRAKVDYEMARRLDPDGPVWEVRVFLID